MCTTTDLCLFERGSECHVLLICLPLGPPHLPHLLPLLDHHVHDLAHLLLQGAHLLTHARVILLPLCLELFHLCLSLLHGRDLSCQPCLERGHSSWEMLLLPLQLSNTLTESFYAGRKWKRREEVGEGRGKRIGRKGRQDIEMARNPLTRLQKLREG